jgi:hypothetical protein
MDGTMIRIVNDSAYTPYNRGPNRWYQDHEDTGKSE